jgi:hypothetical protein
VPFQNVATLAFIACLAAADFMGYLLNIYPASGLLWALNLNFANFFNPMLTILDDNLAAGLASNLVFYGLVSLLPIYALIKKARLPSAIYCHASLATVVALVFAYGPNRILQVDVADRSGAIFASFLPTGRWEVILLISVAIALAAACVHAHISMVRNAITEIKAHNLVPATT